MTTENTPYFGYVENPVLDSLELSVRADRVLRSWGGVKTLDDFMALTREQVTSLKGAGVKTWKEVRDIQHYFQAQPMQAVILSDATRARAPDMSLRDAAALAALQGMLSNPNAAPDRRTARAEKAYAESAWLIADAFIAARDIEEVKE